MERRNYFAVFIVIAILAIVSALVFQSIKAINSNNSLEKKLIKLSAENERLKIENENLKRRIKPAQIWLPDSLTFAGQDVPLNNWYVRKKIREKLKAFLEGDFSSQLNKVFLRSDYWTPFIIKEAHKLEFTEDVLYLFMQESAFDPLARSSADALGMSQFMPGTAVRYGLKIKRNVVDERLLPEKAIPSAIKYLKNEIQKVGGDIFLALAAYNTGMGRIKTALRKNLLPDSSYFNLSELPEETRDFVYKIIAWKLISEHSEKYHVNHTRQKFDYPNIKLEKVKIKRWTKIGSLAAKYGMGQPEFEELNAHLLSETLPPGEYTIRLYSNQPSK